jgi:hypothetical protein
MNWEHIAPRWSEYKWNARRRWSLLTPADLDVIAGDRGQLAAKVAELYALPRERAEQELGAWLAALRELNPFR